MANALRKEENQEEEVQEPIPAVDDKTIKALVKAGDLPNRPGVLGKIKSGELNLDRVRQLHARAKTGVNYAPKKKAFVKEDIPVPSIDRVLQEAVAKGELPNRPNILKKIKSGDLSFSKVKQKHAEAKDQFPVVSVGVPDLQTDADKERDLGKKTAFQKQPQLNLEINKASDVKAIPMKWDSVINNIYYNKLTGVTKPGAGPVEQAMKPTFKRESVVDFYGMNPGTYEVDTGNQFTITEGGSILFGNLNDEERGRLKEALNARSKSYDLNQAISFGSQKTLEGMTFGLYDPSIDPVDATQAVMGIATDFAGGFVTGAPITRLFQQVPIISKLISESTKVGKTIETLKKGKKAQKLLDNTKKAKEIGRQINKMRVAKGTVDAVVIGSESFLTGGVVGVTRSLIRGDEEARQEGTYKFKGVRGVVEDGIVEGALYTGFGLALTPLVSMAGKLFGRRQQLQADRAMSNLAEDVEINRLIKETTPKNIDDVVSGLEQAKKAGEATPEQLRSLDTIEKMRATEPIVGTEAALLSNPEVLALTMKERARVISNDLIGENGSLSALLGDNPQLKLMYDTGKHLDVLDNIQSSMTDAIAKDPDAQRFIAAPFTQNADTMYDVFANRITKTVQNPQRFPELKKFIVNYMENPSAQNELLLKQAGPRGVASKVSKSEFYDARLAPQEIDVMVDGFFNDALQNLSSTQSNKRAFNKGLYGKLKTTDEMLASAVSFNKELNRSFMGAYSDNPYSFDDNFSRANPELMEPVKNVINMKRLMFERSTTLKKRREISVALKELDDQMRVAPDKDAVRQLEMTIQQNKDKQRSLTGLLGKQNRDINKIQTSLDALDSELKTNAYAFAEGVHLPSRPGSSFEEVVEVRMETRPQIEGLRKQLAAETEPDVKSEILQRIKGLRNKFTQSIENSRRFMDRFGANDKNPKFINANSELADAMNAFVANGTDISDELSKTFTLRNLNPFFSNIENPRRQLAREFGPNNVFEKFINKVKSRDVAIDTEMKRFNKMIDDIGIRAGSKESNIMQRLGEGRLSKDSSEFMKLKPIVQEKILKGLDVTRKIYDDIIDTMNQVSRENHLPEIRKMDNYFLHFGETMDDFGTRIVNWMRGDQNILEPKNKSGRLYLQQKFIADPNRTLFSSEKKRKGGEFIDDAIGGMKLYLKPSMERIFYSDLIRELDTAKQFAPTNLGAYLQNIKEAYLLKAPHALDQMATKTVKRLFTSVRNRLGKGAILFNVNSMAQQLLSLPQNFAVSPWEGVRAMGQLFTKEGNNIAKNSKVLQLRDPLYFDIDRDTNLLRKTVFQKLGIGAQGKGKVAIAKDKGKEYWEAIGGWGMNTFDRVAVKHGYLTGYNKAIKAGATKKEAGEFADRWVEMIQNDMTRMSQPQFYQSVLGKSVGQFQSFLTNFAATIMNDLPNIARRDGASRAVSMIVKSVAGMSISNEMAKAVGIPAPFDLDTFIPYYGTFRFGAPGMASVLPNAFAYLAGDERTQKMAARKLARLGASLMMPGGGQFMKTGQALLEEEGQFQLKDRAAMQVEKKYLEVRYGIDFSKPKSIDEFYDTASEYDLEAVDDFLRQEMLLERSIFKKQRTKEKEDYKITPFKLISKKHQARIFGPVVNYLRRKEQEEEEKPGFVGKTRKKIRRTIFNKKQ